MENLTFQEKIPLVIDGGVGENLANLSKILAEFMSNVGHLYGLTLAPGFPELANWINYRYLYVAGKKMSGFSF